MQALWQKRELIYILAWRDFKVRYKQTMLRFAWVLIVPFFYMVVLTLFFNRVAKIETDVPYPLFSYAAILPWTLFTSGVSKGCSSLLSDSVLVKHMSFPKMVIPISSTLSHVIDFGASLLILVGLMAYFQFAPPVQALFIIPLIALTMLVVWGISLWLSAINIRWRDVQWAVPVLLQLALFVSPVGYSTDIVGDQLKWIFAVNPMTGIIEGFRWSLLGQPMDWSLLGISIGITALILVTGYTFFRNKEKGFVDVI